MTAKKLHLLSIDLKKRFQSLKEIVGYGLASVAALGIDFSIYAMFLHVGIGPFASAGAGFLGGAATAYLISVGWVFKSRNKVNKLAELSLFIAIGIGGLALTELLLWLFIRCFSISPMYAKGLCAVLVFWFNFFTRRALLFSQAKPKIARPGP